MKNRVESLDWLRGLMAIAIMFYHLVCAHFFHPDSSALLGRLGIYGVSIFFVLSGLSMAIVYSEFITDKQTSFIFFVRRIFRIWPLLWVCIFFVLLLDAIMGKGYSVFNVVANLTSLFAFISPDSHINVGVWSIGSEMVYYAFTPFIIMLYRAGVRYGNLLLLATFVITIIFSFYLMDSHIPLASQWVTYINPFNNIFLYVSGFGVYFNMRNADIGFMGTLIMLGVSMGVFLFYPVDGDQVMLVTGMNRIVFVFASIILVLSFYKFSYYEYVSNIVKYPLEQFGIATYGVYLLHPVINVYVEYARQKLALWGLSVMLLFVVEVVLTIFIAIYSFNHFEKNMMKLGKKVTSEDGFLWRSLKRDKNLTTQ